ncbi:MAG TPA: VOC family protein, partial [Aquihabitans sp.]|nr:VOC family protein [Aquihabitans sp.]
MQIRMENVVFDARDHRALAHWWADALGWIVHNESEDEVGVCAEVNPDGSYPSPELTFVPVDDPGAGRERVHLELNSTSVEDQRATVERLLALGAAHADVGQAPDAPFVVLADPEGNHLCVLDPRPEYAHLGSLAGYTLAAHDAGALRELWRVATG